MNHNSTTRNCILTQTDSKRKLRRMALEIAERNTELTELIVAGVEGNGVVVAKRLVDELQNFLQVSVQYVTIHLNKQQPVEVTLSTEIDFTGKTILVVDDVANTGRTLLFALKPFLQFRPKSIQTLVLVERSHKQFPIMSDFVGLSLSTTLQEHILVETEGEEIKGAWLH